MVKIAVTQGNLIEGNANRILFRFNKSSFRAAMDFAEVCVETADSGTEVTISLDDEKED